LTEEAAQNTIAFIGILEIGHIIPLSFSEISDTYLFISLEIHILGYDSGSYTSHHLGVNAIGKCLEFNPKVSLLRERYLGPTIARANGIGNVIILQSGILKNLFIAITCRRRGIRCAGANDVRPQAIIDPQRGLADSRAYIYAGRN
jgi:hypothetical protein